MAEKSFRVSPQLRAGKLKNHAYVYPKSDSAFSALQDGRAHAVTSSFFTDVNFILSLTDPSHLVSEKQILATLGKKSGRSAIAQLLDWGYLTDAEAQTSGDPHLRLPTFFNVPADFPDRDADVAIVGLPLAHRFANHGATVGADLLRAYTAEHLDWFEICAQGVHSEIAMAGGPELICAGVVPKDFGNLKVHDRKLSALTQDLKRSWKHFSDCRLRPLFIGGDHAITHPILAALGGHSAETLKSLTIVHLDAHSDCYSGAREESFHHASVIMNILNHLPVRKVVSLGLRNWIDIRSAGNNGYGSAIEKHRQTGRLEQYGIQETLEILRSPDRLSKIIGSNQGSKKSRRDSPVYLTIDIDFLCEQLVEGAVWTPMGSGASWPNLFRCIELLKGRHEVIGADVVEYNPMGKNATKVQWDLAALLVWLVELLSQKR